MIDKKTKRKRKSRMTAKAKAERTRRRQEAKLLSLHEREKSSRKAAKILYRRYADFVKILAEIKQLKEERKNWDEIEATLRQNPVVKRLMPRQAVVVVEAEGVEINLDFRKSVREIANGYFEDAKKARKSINKLVKAMEKLVIKPLIEIEGEWEEAKKRRKKEWYERYRWFRSSDGIVVIAGKDAEQNEELVKRHSRPYDTLMHADIYGSPFAVVRNDERIKLPEQTVKEAAEFVAAHSRAWRSKLLVADVYCMSPDQAVKAPGLPTGSFLIRGKRKWLKKVQPRLAIGIAEKGLVSGPVDAVKRQTAYSVTIVPGDMAAEELAARIKRRLKRKIPFRLKKAFERIKAEEIKALIPYGKGELV